MSSEAKKGNSIVRSWCATATRARVADYERHLRETVVPQLEAISGYRGIMLLRCDRGVDSEIRVLTHWESMDAIRRFAGDSPEVAVVEPDAQAVLLAFDREVTHHEVLFAASGDG
jgi:heme-degrading monooxygenase HmoA